MKRAYISCPLEAALAAKNHGFEFFVKFPNYDCPYEVVCMEDDDICDVESALKYIDRSFKDYKIYIADESLPLLDPKLGDLVKQFGRSAADCIYNLREDICGKKTFIWQTGEYNFYSSIEKIIQRNGKPFPTIQYEDV